MDKADMELARSYFEANATSAAFANYDDPNISIKQRMLEFELEKILGRCHELTLARQHGVGQGKQVLISEVPEVPELLALRQDRNQRVLKARTVAAAPDLPEDAAEVLQAELKRVSEPASAVGVLGELGAFYKHRVQLLESERIALMLRHGEHCDGLEQIERVAPALNSRLERVHLELSDSQARLDRVSTLSATEPGDEAVWAGLQPEDVTVLTRFTVHQESSKMAVERMLGGLRWTSVSCRMSIRKALDSSQSKHHSQLPIASAQLVAMPSTNPEVDSSLQHILAHGDVCSILPPGFDPKSGLGDGDELLYLVNQAFNRSFARQLALMHFPEYDFSWLRDQAAASENQKLKMDKLKAEVSFDPKGAGSFLKPCTWAPFCKLAPRPDSDQEELLLKLRSIEQADIRLQAELEALEVRDSEYAKKRLHNLVETHESRMIVGPGSSIADIQGKNIKDQFDSVALRFASAEDAGPKKDWNKNSNQIGLKRRKLCALYLLQYLGDRERRTMVLGNLNYFRSLERRLTIDSLGLSMMEHPETPEQLTQRRSERAGDYALFGDEPLEGFPAYHHLYDEPGDLLNTEGLTGVRGRFDVYSIGETGVVHVQDAMGVGIMYDCSLQDLEDTEAELLRLGTYFIQKHRTELRHPESGKLCEVNHASVLTDLLECESCFLTAKRSVVSILMAIYELVYDPVHKKELAQLLTDKMAARPRIDFEACWFKESYVLEIECLGLEAELLTGMLAGLKQAERKSAELNQDSCNGSPSELAGSWPWLQEHMLGDLLKDVGLLDFMPSAASVCSVLAQVQSTQQELRTILQIQSTTKATHLAKLVLEVAVASWKLQEPGLCAKEGYVDEAGDVVKRFATLEAALERASNPNASNSMQVQARVRQLSVVRLWHCMVQVCPQLEMLSAVYGYQRTCLGLNPEDSRELSTLGFTDSPVQHSNVLPLPAGVPSHTAFHPAPSECMGRLRVGSEFDKSLLLAVDFCTVQGVAAMIESESGLFCVRTAARLQLCERDLLVAATHHNQLLVDLVAPGGPQRKPSRKDAVGNTFMTQAPTKSASNQEKSREVAEAVTNLLELTDLKNTKRKAMCSVYAEKSPQLSLSVKGQDCKGAVLQALRGLEFELINTYCDGMKTCARNVMTKISVIHLMTELRHCAMQLPNEGAPFKLQDKDDRTFLDSNGSPMIGQGIVKSVWTLPHPLELLSLNAMLDADALRNYEVLYTPVLELLALLSFHRLSCLPPHSLGYTSEVLLILDCKIDNTNKTELPAMLDLFLHRRSEAWSTLLLILYLAGQQFLDKQNSEAFNLTRATLLSLTNPQEQQCRSVLFRSDSITELRVRPFTFAVSSLCDAELLSVIASSVIAVSLLDTAVLNSRAPQHDLDRLGLKCSQELLCLFQLQAELAHLRGERDVSQRCRSVLEGHKSALLEMGTMVAQIENNHRVIVTVVPEEDSESPHTASEEEEEQDYDDECDSATLMTRLTSQNVCASAILSIDQEIQLHLLNTQIEHCTGLYSVAVDELEGRKAGLGSHGWPELFTRFMCDIMDGATRTTDPRTSGPGIALADSHMTRCVDELGLRARELYVTEQADVVKGMNMQNAEMRERLYLMEQYCKQLECIRANEKKAAIRRVKTEVIDNCYDLIFDARDAAGRLAELEAESAVMEKTLRRDIKQGFDQELLQLKTDLATTQSNFKEYRLNLFQQMLSNMGEIRKEAIMQFAAHQLVPDETAEKTRQAISLEDQISTLQQQVNDKSRAIVKLKTMASLKRLSARFELDEQLAELNRRSADEQSLKERRHEFDTREAALKLQLSNTQDALSAMEVELMEAREKLNISTKLRKDLVNWKIATSEQLTSLQGKVSKFEKWDMNEMEKIMADRASKSSELNRLQKMETKTNRKNHLVEAKADRKLAQLNRKLLAEKSVKNDAFRKVQMLRDEITAASEGDATAGEVQQWMDRYLGCSNELEAASKENEALRQCIKDLGLDPCVQLGSATPTQLKLVSPVKLSPQRSRPSTGDTSKTTPARSFASHGRPPSGGSRSPGLAAMRPMTSHGGPEEARICKERARDISLSGARVKGVLAAPRKK